LKNFWRRSDVEVACGYQGDKNLGCVRARPWEQKSCALSLNASDPVHI
jgi:hypothetical protein